MTGRGIDHILRRPSTPALQDPDVQDARTYVELAEAASGPIPRGVDDAYIWGDALEEFDRMEPDARVVNLETTVTRSDDAWPKLINYRMHPANVGCFTVAKLDVCVLANNHVLDYGYAGLCETLETLTSVGLKVAGAGLNQEEARRPARIRIADGRNLIVFGFGAETSGIPASWAASNDRPGVDLLSHLSEATAAALLDRVARVKRPGDLVVVSIHWGGNWGYAIPDEHVQFAHWLVDGGVDLVHGHSSHHPRGIEVYADRLILYGCGDCINDEGGACETLRACLRSRHSGHPRHPAVGGWCPESPRARRRRGRLSRVRGDRPALVGRGGAPCPPSGVRWRPGVRGASRPRWRFCWPGWWGPAWYRYPYPYPVTYASPPVIQQEAPTYAPPASTGQYWYYCPDSRTYYPYTQQCPSGWLQVVPSPPAPGRGY